MHANRKLQDELKNQIWVNSDKWFWSYCKKKIDQGQGQNIKNVKVKLIICQNIAVFGVKLNILLQGIYPNYIKVHNCESMHGVDQGQGQNNKNVKVKLIICRNKVVFGVKLNILFQGINLKCLKTNNCTFMNVVIYYTFNVNHELNFIYQFALTFKSNILRQLTARIRPYDSQSDTFNLM